MQGNEFLQQKPHQKLPFLLQKHPQKPGFLGVFPSREKESKEKKSKVANAFAGSDDPAHTPDLKQKDGYSDEFEAFWQRYDKRSASKKKAFGQWNKLSQKDRQKATQVLPAYLAHQPDAQYRKDPERWLSQRAFEHDYTLTTTGIKPIGQREFVA